MLTAGNQAAPAGARTPDRGLGHHLPKTGDSREDIQHHQLSGHAVSGQCPGLPPYPQDNEGGPSRLPVDQVKRMRRFQAAYPEVDIERPDYANGKTWWHAHLEGRRIASDTELRGLLDQLGRLLGKRPAIDRRAVRDRAAGARHICRAGRLRCVPR